jgi:hypothetical protein
LSRRRKRIEFRIGINVGDVIIEGDDVFGDGVNIAARLEQLAEVRGVCISRAAYEQVRDKLAFKFQDCGQQTVKNIARPIRGPIVSQSRRAADTSAAGPCARGAASRPWLGRRSWSPSSRVGTWLALPVFTSMSADRRRASARRGFPSRCSHSPISAATRIRIISPTR